MRHKVPLALAALTTGATANFEPLGLWDCDDRQGRVCVTNGYAILVVDKQPMCHGRKPQRIARGRDRRRPARFLRSFSMRLRLRHG